MLGDGCGHLARGAATVRGLDRDAVHSSVWVAWWTAQRVPRLPHNARRDEREPEVTRIGARPQSAHSAEREAQEAVRAVGENTGDRQLCPRRREKLSV